MRGKGLIRLADHPGLTHSPLHILHITHLDIRHTGIAELHQVGILSPYSLDIRDTPVEELFRLRWSSIRELTLEPGRFAPEILGPLSLRTRVLKLAPETAQARKAASQ
jgi:hypothetical protein